MKKLYEKCQSSLSFAINNNDNNKKSQFHDSHEAAESDKMRNFIKSHSQKKNKIKRTKRSRRKEHSIKKHTH